MGPWVVIFTFQTKSRGVEPEHVGFSNPSINLAMSILFYHCMGPWAVILTFQTKSRGVGPEQVHFSNPSINLANFSTSVTNLSNQVLSLYGSTVLLEIHQVFSTTVSNIAIFIYLPD